mmetsp:Transcript_3096/g.7923  ORF Transcript_3096/g.7923 Transcript_3096/m.7923 type:complete len:396 (-) Transcript_3096:748-1935(-)
MLNKLSVLDDFPKKRKRAASARGLRIVRRLRRRRLDDVLLLAGPRPMRAHLHERRRSGEAAIKGLQARKCFMENRDGCTLVRDRNLERAVFRLPLLAHGFETDLRLGHVRLQFRDRRVDGLHRLGEMLVLPVEILLLLLGHLDLVLAGVELLVAEFNLFVFLLLLGLQLLHHLIHHDLHLSEIVELHSGSEGRKSEVVVPPGHNRHAPPRALACALQRRRNFRGRADLHETHGLAEELSRVIIPEDCQRIAQGRDFLGAHLHTRLVLVRLGSAALRHVRQKLLVSRQRRLRRSDVLLRCRGLVQELGKGAVFHFPLFRRSGDLPELRCFQSIELIERLRFLFLRGGEVTTELVAHLGEDAQNLAAPRVVRLRSGGCSRETAGIRSVLVESCGTMP